MLAQGIPGLHQGFFQTPQDIFVDLHDRPKHPTSRVLRVVRASKTLAETNWPSLCSFHAVFPRNRKASAQEEGYKVVSSLFILKVHSTELSWLLVLLVLLCEDLHFSGVGLREHDPCCVSTKRRVAIELAQRVLENVDAPVGGFHPQIPHQMKDGFGCDRIVPFEARSKDLVEA